MVLYDVHQKSVPFHNYIFSLFLLQSPFISQLNSMTLAGAFQPTRLFCDSV